MSAATAELSARDRAVLEFERSYWHPAYIGLKDTAVRELFGMTWVRYVQVLHAILEKPEAEVYDPQLVRQLVRLRDARLERRRHGQGFSLGH